MGALNARLKVTRIQTLARTLEVCCALWKLSVPNVDLHHIPNVTEKTEKGFTIFDTTPSLWKMCTMQHFEEDEDLPSTSNPSFSAPLVLEKL